MAWLRDSKRHPDNSKQQAWGVFGQDNAVWERQCENCRTRDPLRPAREATAVSSARLTRNSLPKIKAANERGPISDRSICLAASRVLVRCLSEARPPQPDLCPPTAMPIPYQGLVKTVR